MALLLALAISADSICQISKPRQQTADLCRVLRSPQKCDNKRVRFKAFMTYSTISRVDGGDSYIYSPDCNNPDNFVVTEYSDSKVLEKGTDFLSALPSEKSYILEIDAVGRFETALWPSFGHLGWSLHRFEIEKIAGIADVTQKIGIVRPDDEADGIITGERSMLKSMNADLILYLSGTSDSFRYGGVSQRTKFVHPSGRSYSGQDLEKVRLSWLVDPAKKWSRKVTARDVDYMKGRFRISGALVFENPTRSEERVVYFYSSYLKKVDDRFEVIKVEFSN